MKEKGILFTKENRQKCRDGTKTQTRRIMKPQPYYSRSASPRFTDTEIGDIFLCPDMLPTSDIRKLVFVECESLGAYHHMGMVAFIEKHARYQVGDHLYMKEPYQIQRGWPSTQVLIGVYLDDNAVIECPVTEHEWGKWMKRKFANSNTSSMFMYKSLARTWLEVTRVWVERVQSISDEDCLAEGIKFVEETKSGNAYIVHLENTSHLRKPCDGPGYYRRTGGPQTCFQMLWDSIHGKDAWKRNDWVWCYEFKRTER